MRSLALALVLGVATLAVPAATSTAEAAPAKVGQDCSTTVAYRGHYRSHYRYHGGYRGRSYWHRGHYYRRGC